MPWGLGSRIILLAVVVPMLAASLVTAYLVVGHGRDVRDEVLRRGEASARQLAPALRYALATRQDAVLRDVAAAAQADPAVARVTVQGADGAVLVERGAVTHAAHGWLERIGSLVLGLDPSPAFRAPVMPPPRDALLAMERSMLPAGWVRVEMDAAPYLRREAGMAARAAGAMGLLLLVTLSLGLLAHRSVQRPIRQLTATVRRLGAGDLRARVHLLAGGEVGLLARAVNRMAIRQERNERELNDQIEQATRELRETLESVEIQNAELDIARKRALEGSKVKSEFLANMSHEIRTPINGILGFADLLSHSRLDEEQRDYVATIRESGTNLIALVNDILDFSKIEAGKLVIDNVALDLRDCVEEVLSLMAPTAYGKSLELVSLIYRDVPLQLFGDPVRIRQVLTNLVHNAVKFTPEGRVVVRVMLEAEDGPRATLRFAVTDTGIGMKPDEQQRLFRAFSQADTSITRRFGGAGLGLIISKKLVEQMGGEIGLESEARAGSTFWFTLQCVKQRRAEADDALRMPATALQGRRLLVHDRSSLGRLAVRHLLESWGAEVHDVGTTEAFRDLALKPEGWDLLLVGLSRDELNGRYFRDLMASRDARACPVIVLASTVDRNELRSLYQQGAASCLPKAVRRHTLYRELCRLLESDGAARSTALPAHPAAPPRPARVQAPTALTGAALVVDDNAINRKLVSTILRRHGADVDEAEDGRAALERCRERDYAVVFLDIHMPVLSGEAAWEGIGAELAAAGRPRPRFVALTANAVAGERERLVALGMDECLIKPVSEEQLLGQLPGGPAGTPGGGPTATGETDLRGMLADELPEHRRVIRQAYRRGDLDHLRECVHRLNGAASVCGEAALQTACAELERSLAAERRVAVPAGVEAVISAVNERLAADHRGG